MSIVKYLPGNLLNLFGAGTNSLNRSLAWHLLVCAANPDTSQRKIQKEIDDVVGQDRQPSWQDSHHMPFTVASIREMQRWKTVMPLAIPRRQAENIVIGGYVIPKGTAVMANLWAVHMDPNLWESPETFNPYRFLVLDDQTLKITTKPDYLIPFSIGKRMCPAEGASTVAYFLYLTSILQKFNVLPEEGQTIDLTSNCVSFNSPKSQRMRFMPRSPIT
ncbi:cytochrome P450 2U1 [Ixodes scapularis]|uniref:cytochrome P450 2U1 n=1 Tax=Ixodes scapularis TaxID=6945 RepID=UPI001A9FD36C|nr:cytochrome P450 2U1 [Ixodes scapularis]